MAFNLLGFLYEGVYAVTCAHYVCSKRCFNGQYSIKSNEKYTSLDKGFEKLGIIETLENLKIDEYTKPNGQIIIDTFTISNKNKSEKTLDCVVKIKLNKGVDGFTKDKFTKDEISKKNYESLDKIINILLNQFPNSIFARKMQQQLIKYVDDDKVSKVTILISTSGQNRENSQNEENLKKIISKMDIKITIVPNSGSKIEIKDTSPPIDQYLVKLNEEINRRIHTENNLLTIQTSLKVSKNKINTKIHNSTRDVMYKFFGYIPKNPTKPNQEEFLKLIKEKFKENDKFDKNKFLNIFKFFMFGYNPPTSPKETFFYNSIIYGHGNQNNVLKELTLQTFESKLKEISLDKIDLVKKQNTRIIIKFFCKLDGKIYDTFTLTIQLYNNEATITISAIFLKKLFEEVEQEISNELKNIK